MFCAGVVPDGPIWLTPRPMDVSGYADGSFLNCLLLSCALKAQDLGKSVSRTKKSLRVH